MNLCCSHDTFLVQVKVHWKDLQMNFFSTKMTSKVERKFLVHDEVQIFNVFLVQAIIKKKV